MSRVRDAPALSRIAGPPRVACRERRSRASGGFAAVGGDGTRHYYLAALIASSRRSPARRSGALPRGRPRAGPCGAGRAPLRLPIGGPLSPHPFSPPGGPTQPPASFWVPGLVTFTPGGVRHVRNPPKIDLCARALRLRHPSVCVALRHGPHSGNLRVTPLFLLLNCADVRSVCVWHVLEHCRAAQRATHVEFQRATCAVMRPVSAPSPLGRVVPPPCGTAGRYPMRLFAGPLKSHSPAWPLSGQRAGVLVWRAGPPPRILGYLSIGRSGDRGSLACCALSWRAGARAA